MNRTAKVVLPLVACILLSFGCTAKPLPDQHPSVNEAEARGAAEDILIELGEWPGDRINVNLNFTDSGKKHIHEWYEFKAWSITSQTVDPIQRWVTFRGFVKPTKHWRMKEEAHEKLPATIGFRMVLVKGRVVKDSDVELWRINEFSFGAAPIEANPPIDSSNHDKEKRP